MVNYTSIILAMLVWDPLECLVLLIVSNFTLFFNHFTECGLDDRNVQNKVIDVSIFAVIHDGELTTRTESTVYVCFLLL